MAAVEAVVMLLVEITVAAVPLLVVMLLSLLESQIFLGGVEGRITMQVLVARRYAMHHPPCTKHQGQAFILRQHHRSPRACDNITLAEPRTPAWPLCLLKKMSMRSRSPEQFTSPCNFPQKGDPISGESSCINSVPPMTLCLPYGD